MKPGARGQFQKGVDDGRISAGAHEEVLATQLARTEVSVAHVKVGYVVDEVPQPFHNGNALVVPFVDERAITKQFVVTEELHIKDIKLIDTVEVPVTVGKMRATVERKAPDGSAPTSE